MLNFLLSSDFFYVVLTMVAYSAGVAIQKKWKLAILNPILIGAALVILVLSLLGISNSTYQEGCTILNFLLTPATICLAIGFYQQFQALKKQLLSICLGVLIGVIFSLACLYGLSRLFLLDQPILLAMLPKSITTAIGVPLCEEIGGISAVTIAAIAITGILGYIAGPTFCKIFKIKDPIAQGVAFGVATHVTGTTKAYEISQLIGAVGSFSLTLAGLITTAVLSILAQFL